MKRILLILALFSQIVLCVQSKELEIGDISHSYYDENEEDVFIEPQTEKRIKISYQNNKATMSLTNIYLPILFNQMTIIGEVNNNVMTIIISRKDINEVMAIGDIYRYYDVNFSINDIEPGEYRIRIDARITSYTNTLIQCDEMFDLKEDSIINKEIGEPIGYEYTPIVRDNIVWCYGRVKFGSFSDKEMKYLKHQDLIRYQFLEDTIVNGLSYKKYTIFDSCELPENPNIRGFFREVDKKVYILDPTPGSEESILYNFSLKMGDNPSKNGNNKEDRIYDICYTEIDGKYRKIQYAYKYNNYFTEGFGTPNIGLLSAPDFEMPNNLDDGGGQFTLLYEKDLEDGTLNYGDYSLSDPCKPENSVDEIDFISNKINIDYSQNQISVSSGSNDLHLSVYDLVGVKVAEASGDGEVSLSTETLPIGIYIVKATSDNGIETAEKKIVVK